VTDKYGVNAVPSFIFLKDGKVLDRVDGANAPELASKCSTYSHLKSSSSSISNPSSSSSSTSSSTKDDLDGRLKKLVNSAPVMLFMKGNPSSPQCGFSRKIVDILKDNKMEFSSFDILSDEEIRQGLKTFSNWPTFPQLYIQGNLIGGLDIVKEMAEEGELAKLVPKPQNKEGELKERLEKLLHSAEVMLFMKGTPLAPQCGFSRKIVDILQKNHIDFQSFNILADEEIRQGLKTYSNWPTYPQLYSKGKLLGGLDIVKELDEEGQLVESL